MAYDPANKVTWLREQNLANGFKLSISEKTGLVKVEVPGAGRRNPMMYADELLAFIDCAIEIQRYLEANHDKAISSGQSKDMRKIAQVQQRTEARAAELVAALPADVLQKLLDAAKKKTA